MSRRTYSREDVQTHHDGFRASRPAVNVKVYGSIHDRKAWDRFHAEEDAPGFTLEWLEENVSDETVDAAFWQVCGWEVECLADDIDDYFPDYRVQLWQEGRSGGWLVVDGLPDLEEWDAILLARWRKFERVARATADYILTLTLLSLYANKYEAWRSEQDDAATYNAEVPVDMAGIA